MMWFAIEAWVLQRPGHSVPDSSRLSSHIIHPLSHPPGSPSLIWLVPKHAPNIPPQGFPAFAVVPSTWSAPATDIFQTLPYPLSMFPSSICSQRRLPWRLYIKLRSCPESLTASSPASCSLQHLPLPVDFLRMSWLSASCEIQIINGRDGWPRTRPGS